jgi:phosphoribosylaminoimidazolecarboxamide formyltransferase/IMP cyclohydrolase
MTVSKIKRALLSASDKTGIEVFAKALSDRGVEIISTGGTAKLLAEHGIKVIKVADVTGVAEMMDGRVKTLNPKIHGGILARRDNKDHLADMKREKITGIDLVAVNLYPFEETLKRPGAGRDALIENIDVGGPAMIRAAAKNHDFVTILTDSEDYQTVLDEIEEEGGTSEATRRYLAAKAFAHTAEYDSTIAAWMDDGEHDDILPKSLSIGGSKMQEMRYGENPHQQAALYRIQSNRERKSVLSSEQIQGKALSFNNINDTDAAFELVAEFGDPSIAIIKHANPCGVASGGDLTAVWQAALASDPVSAFGGIVAVNKTLNGALAREITKIFTEVVIAPDADKEARAVMAEKPDLRLLLSGGMPDPGENGLVFRSVSGGFLAQTRDNGRLDPKAMECVTKRQPTKKEERDLHFAMVVAKHVKSNAIVYAKNLATVGIGAGQMSRLDSSRIAARKADDLAENKKLKEPPTIGSVVASDAFFPFADGLMAAADAGATAIIQPGGSKRDEEVIAAADKAGLAMIFTGMRHFRH